MDLHILSDPVFNFWKCPKKGLNKLLLTFFTTFFTHLIFRERNYSGDPKKSPKGDPGGPFLRDKGDPWGTLFERKRGPLDFFVNHCK